MERKDSITRTHVGSFRTLLLRDLYVSYFTSLLFDLSMISADQIRAARALLGISAASLSERSGVDLRTIQRFEAAEGIPKSRSGTLERVKTTLEAAGIVFIGDPVTSPGAQLRRPQPEQFEQE